MRTAKVFIGAAKGLQNEINQIVDTLGNELVDVRLTAEPSQGQSAVVAVIIYDKS
jgi:ribosome maturation factor RimP